MPEDVVAKIVIEDGSSGGGSKIPSPRQQKRDQTQESIAKNLSGVGKFFSGGEITQLTSSLKGLPALIKSLAVAAGAIAGIAVIGGAASSVVNNISNVYNITDEEKESREELTEEIEKGTTTAEDNARVMDYLGSTVEDTEESLGFLWKEFKNGDLTVKDLFSSFLGIIDTTASLGEAMNSLRKHIINLQNDTGGKAIDSPVVRSGQRTYSGATPFEQARQESVEQRNPFLSSISQPEGYVSPTTLATSQANFLIGSDRTSSFTRE